MQVVETAGPTEASAQITTDTVWGPQGSPYIVRGMTIAKGASLTLLPGTVVKIDWHKSIYAVGQLLSLGTPTDRVVITSLRDDDVMGDTNGDGSSTTPAAGDWYHIRIAGGNPPYEPDFNLTGSVIDYSDIRYGGWGSACHAYGAVDVDDPGSRLIMSNSSVTRSQNAGVYVYGPRDKGFVGLYNSLFASSCIGLSMTNGVMADVVGNTFEADFTSRAIHAATPRAPASLRSVRIDPPM
jgi:hypothetical protein